MRSVGPAIVFIGLITMMSWTEVIAPEKWAVYSEAAKNLGYWMMVIALAMFFFSWIKDMSS